MKLLVKNIQQIVQISDSKQKFIRGQECDNLKVLKAELSDRSLYILVGENGKVAELGQILDADHLRKLEGQAEKILDANFKAVIPGLVDSHTHSVWDGDRVHEFKMKLAGATYMDIHNMGGGIHFTVNATRNASVKRLYDLFKSRLSQMLNLGTTTLEIKSGYGLDIETEIKMLKVINLAKKDPEIKQKITATYLGPHAIPKGKTAEEQTEIIVAEHFPKLLQAVEAGEIHIDQFDAFTEKDCFSIEQTQRIMAAAEKYFPNCTLNIHVDELSPLGGAEMVAGFKNGRAASHLEECSELGCEKLSEHDIAAVLLPTTALQLKLKPPPSRTMVEKNCIVALGSDFNPNAHCFSMPLVMYFGCTAYSLTMNESICGATLNSAYAIDMQDLVGSIEVGKAGDLLVLSTGFKESSLQEAQHSRSPAFKKASL